MSGGRETKLTLFQRLHAPINEKSAVFCVCGGGGGASLAAERSLTRLACVPCGNRHRRSMSTPRFALGTRTETARPMRGHRLRRRNNKLRQGAVVTLHLGICVRPMKSSRTCSATPERPGHLRHRSIWATRPPTATRGRLLPRCNPLHLQCGICEGLPIGLCSAYPGGHR